jgi:gluconokinase
VYLKGTPELLQERIKTRQGHFFDPKLLQSQLDTLEPPGPDEAIEADIALTPEQIVDKVFNEIRDR